MKTIWTHNGEIKDIWKQTDVFHNDLKAIERYARLKKIYHIDISPEAESIMTDEAKIKLIYDVIALLDSLGNDFERLEKQKKQFLQLKNYAKGKNKQYFTQIRPFLEQHRGFSLENEYTLRGFLNWLGTLPEKITNPMVFFEERAEDVKEMVRFLEADNQKLQNKIRKVEFDTQKLFAEAQRHLMRDLQKWERRTHQPKGISWPSSSGRSNSGGWSGSSGLMTVFRGGGFKSGGGGFGSW